LASRTQPFSHPKDGAKDAATKDRVAPQATVISAQEAQNDGSTGYPE